MPVGYPRGQMAGVVDGPGEWTSAELQAVHKHRVGLAIFHDGNPGHLWRAELASQMAEAALAAGVLMWLASVTNAPMSVALAVVAMGLPFLLIRPLAIGLESSADPTRWMRWLGRLRVVGAASLVALQFHTIWPAVYGALFLISTLGRMREAARIGAIRTCLGRGEPEHVANDTYIGAVIAGVLGPLIGMACYVLLEEKLLLVGVVCAVMFIISANSDNFLDTLPAHRRAFLLVNPESLALLSDGDAPPAPAPTDDDEDEALDDAALDLRRELALPEWYQQGPTSPGKALADIRAGLGLAGATGASAVGLWLLSALALIGGGLAALEVFYVTREIVTPSYFLGPLLAAEAAGFAVGFYLAHPLLARGAGKATAFGGVIGSGVALAALAVTPKMPLPLAVTFLLGLANALGVAGARHLLLSGYDGIERRALSAAEAWTTPLCAAVGALAFAYFYQGSASATATTKHSSLTLPSWPIAYLLVMMGVGLIGAGVLLAAAQVMMGKPRTLKAKSTGKRKAGATARGRHKRADDDDADDADDENYTDSRAMPGVRGGAGWDDEEDERDDGHWQESGEYDEYAESGVYQDSRYDAAVDPYDDEPDDSPRGRSSARRPDARDKRSRR
jgi:hypothetical protein